MNRYLFSFIITILVYLLIFAIYIYNNDLANKSVVNLKKENKIAFKVINEPKKLNKVLKKQDIKKTIQKKVIKKKIIKKKIIKKRIIKKIEKNVEKETAKIVKSKVKNIISNKKEVLLKKELEKKNILPKLDNPKEKILEKLRVDYLNLVKRTINSNKSFPKSAKRRGLQGEVKIKFDVSKKGKLLSFHILNGNSSFFKASSKALKKSFPILRPKEIQKKILHLSINLKYILK